MSDALITRPLVRWHGGKFRIAKWILSVLPDHRIYVEPFGGGGSILLRKPRAYCEIYNDLDGEIVNLFRMARDRGDELCRRIALTPFAREEFQESKEFPEDPMERARLLLVRSHMGVGSNSSSTKNTRHGKIQTGFRTSVRRRGTIPAVDWARFPDSLAAVVNRLRGVIIESVDAAVLIQKNDGEDSLFYVDPPYLPETRDDGRADYRHEMTREDHGKLAEVLKACKGKIVLSGYASEFYETLYSGWERIECAALADGGRARTEVLWMNFKPNQGRLEL